MTVCDIRQGVQKTRREEKKKENRGYRSFRDNLKELMSVEIRNDPRLAEQLAALGQPPTYGSAISWMLTQAAMEGEMDAARFIRDTLGEKPREKYEVGVEKRPVQALDLTRLTDAQLEQLADQAQA